MTTLVFAALLLIACGGSGAVTSTPTPSPVSTPAPTPSGQAAGMVFMVRDGHVAPLRRYLPAGDEQSRLIGALKALLEGPTPSEQQAGYSTALAPGTQLRAIVFGEHTATVELTGARSPDRTDAAQVVFTLTQFDPASSVGFAGDAAPSTRTDYESLTPAVLILSPLPGDSISSPFTVSGTANVFEAQFSLDLAIAGITAAVPVRATSGTGTRGSFSVTLDAGGRHGQATIAPWDASPKDGSRIDYPAVAVTVA